MKRLLMILLAVLVLAGCAKDEPQVTVPLSTEGDTTNSLYVPDSAIQQQTGGAVCTYEVEADSITGIYTMGANLLLAGQGEMTVISPEEGEVLATAKIEGAYTDLTTSTTGVYYYQQEIKRVVAMNPQLYLVTQLQMPEQMVGQPQICGNSGEVFYSVGNEIRAIDMDTGVSRLLRQQASGKILLEGIYFDGTVLACRIVDEAGKETVQYISAETGVTVSEVQTLTGFYTYGDRYFAEWKDGSVNHTICGSRDAEPMNFYAALPIGVGPSGRRPLLAMNGVVDYVETGDGLDFTYYDLATGKHTAYQQLPKLLSPRCFHSDGKYVWFLATDGESTKQLLYRWDVTLSPYQSETVYTSALYTAENPDTQGIAQCKELADTYAKKYGVKLHIWQDAVKHIGDHTVTVEYHTSVIREMLEKLQPSFALFPGNFLLKTVEKGWVRICLVRDIDDGTPWTHIWENGDCWVLISSNADPVDAFYQGLAYAIDSHVLGNSRDFDADRWAALNPEGFAYPYSYQVEEIAEYLQGETRAFTDALAMTYPHEDRCRIFYNAMLADNAEMFRSPIMQAKLLQLCKGIREGYSLEKSTATYQWEQYLQTSLAYVEQ